jgi:hypothetical protein
MSVFVVKRTLPGITPDALAGAGLRARTCSAEMTEEGTPVRWIRSYFLPDVQQTHCYFEAPDEQSVREVNERASIPFTSVHEVHELTPESV